MRIGIYTFTIADNYGALLQAYALKKYLSDLGHEVNCIDYRPQYLADKYIPFSRERLKGKGSAVVSIIKECFKYPIITKKKRAFDLFRENYLSLEEDRKNYDLYIIGSDQVWNFSITNADPVFLGYLNNAKVVSYAASMESIKNEELPVLKKALTNFSKISVREDSLRECLKSFFSQESTLVIDPTFLLERNEWNQIVQPLPQKKDYLLIYIFGLSNSTVSIIDAYAKREGLSTFYISEKLNFSSNFIKTASPNEFITLFSGANKVITNSFHGTAFSIIYGKPFISIKKASNERIGSLLELANAKEAMTDHLELALNEDKFIKVDAYPEKLNSIIKQSKSYLNDITN